MAGHTLRSSGALRYIEWVSQSQSVLTFVFHLFRHAMANGIDVTTNSVERLKHNDPVVGNVGTTQQHYNFSTILMPNTYSFCTEFYFKTTECLQKSLTMVSLSPTSFLTFVVLLRNVNFGFCIGYLPIHCKFIFHWVLLYWTATTGTIPVPQVW